MRCHAYSRRSLSRASERGAESGVARPLLFALLLLPLLATPAAAATTQFDAIAANTQMYTAAQADAQFATSSHTHAAADVTSGTFAIGRIPTGTSSSTVCIGDDARLSDARTPTSHVHPAGDITSGTMATARLGSGSATSSTFLRGDQSWAVPTSSALLNVLTPAQITATQNDYSPGTLTGFDVAMLTTDVNRLISGFAGGSAGYLLGVCNANAAAGGTIAIRDDNAGSSAANRVDCTSEMLLQPGEIVWLVYDGTNSRWHASRPQAGGVGAVHALRALGTAGDEACAGDDGRLSDSRAPSGSAGGDLAGTYPNPTVSQSSTSFALTADISPSTLSTTENNFNPTGLSTASVLRITPHASGTTLTGIQGGADGRILALVNISASNLTLSVEDTSSTAGNRFSDSAGSETLTQGRACVLCYDATVSRWRVIAGDFGTLAHESTHHRLGSDELDLDALGDPSDTTALNSSTSAHGLLRKLDNNAAHFLDGTGAWGTVSDSEVGFTDITTGDASTSNHGFLKKLPGTTTTFLRGDGTFVAPTPAGTLIQVTFVNTGTTFTTNASTTSIFVELVGGGGGGGGVTSAASAGACGGGGAGGAYATKSFTVTGSTGYTIAIGAAGTAGTTTPTAGGVGGDTTFTVSGVTVTAKGGGGGNAMATGTSNLYAVGGSGVVATTGLVNGSGQSGQWGHRDTGLIGASGSGGSSIWGGGGVGLIASATGNDGISTGGGGGGGCTLNNGGAKAGGAGVKGGIQVWEFR